MCGNGVVFDSLEVDATFVCRVQVKKRDVLAAFSAGFRINQINGHICFIANLLGPSEDVWIQPT